MKGTHMFVLPVLLILAISCASLREEHKGVDRESLPRSVSTPPVDEPAAEKKEAAILGRLAGPMAGGAIGEYASDATRTQDETNKEYGYAHDRGTAARIESVQVKPRFTKPGDWVDLKIVYVVLTHSSEPTLVREVREIWYREHLWGSPEVRVERVGGTYESNIPLCLPEDLKPGTYKLRYIVQTPTSRDVRETNFTVQK